MSRGAKWSVQAADGCDKESTFTETVLTTARLLTGGHKDTISVWVQSTG